MKKLMIISSCVLYAFIFTSSIEAKRPVSKTLKIFNRTSIPLTIQLQSSYPDSVTNEPITENKTLQLAANIQGSISFKLYQSAYRNVMTYSGGPISLQVFAGNNPINLIATYNALINSNGQKYFEALRPAGFSYNLLSIYESTAPNASSPIYLAYDKINLGIGTV